MSWTCTVCGEVHDEQLRDIRAGWPELRIVELRRNCGHQGALTAGLARSRGSLVVTIDAQGQPFLDKEPLAPETMMPRLRQLASVDPSQVVLVRGDKAVPYGRIIEIMGQINAAGFSKVSLIAQAPSGSPAQ